MSFFDVDRAMTVDPSSVRWSGQWSRPLTPQLAPTSVPMRKHEGRDYSSCLDIAELGDRVIHDVNGYYKALGLRDQFGYARRKVKQVEIKRAWRKRTRLFHPDTGPQPNVLKFEYVQVAYEVLGDIDNRVIYDSLEPGQLWTDRFVAQKMKEAMAERMQTTEDAEEVNEEVAEMVREQEEEFARWRGEAPLPDLPGAPSSYRYYVDEDVEGEPASDLVDAWLRHLALAYYRLDRRDTVLLGFTEGTWRREQTPWGQYIVVPLRGEVSYEAAAYYVAEKSS